MLKLLTQLYFLSVALLFCKPLFACDIQIKKTAYPILGSVIHNNLCIDEYFKTRDLASYQISNTSMTFLMSKSATSLQYDDMILFDLPIAITLPLEDEGQLRIVKRILNAYFDSLRSEFGPCKLKMFDGEIELSLEDFKVTQRNLDGQPGSRMMLTKDDVAIPHWELKCPVNQEGDLEVVKSGHYFFVFADVHENVSIKTTTTHYAQFLFSFRD